MPSLHVIAAGSLLEFSLQSSSFAMPVGRIDYMYIGPITFEEFLLAMGESSLLEFLNEYQLTTRYPTVIHKKLMSLLKIYCMIGGMPQAMVAYLTHHDVQDSEKVKHSILNTYQDDFSKYTTASNQEHIRLVFNKLPLFIGKKIKYSHFSNQEKSRVIADALEKLSLARVVHLIYHSASNGIPLGAEINPKAFKAIFLDVGLLMTRLGIHLLHLQKVDELTLINSGAIAEQLIGQHLLQNNPFYQQPQLYYWMRDKKSSSAEIDYVISYGQKIIPIEVKAGKSGTLKSLHYFMNEKNLNFAARFNAQLPSLCDNTATLSNGKSIQYQLLSLPLYFVAQLPRLLNLIES